MRIRPYKTVDHKIEGAVISLLDIDPFKQTQLQLESNARFSRAAFDAVQSPLAILGEDLRVEAANPAFCRMLGVTREEAENRPLFRVGKEQISAQSIRAALEGVVRGKLEAADIDVDMSLTGAGSRKMRLHASAIAEQGDSSEKILLSVGSPERAAEGGS